MRGRGEVGKRQKNDAKTRQQTLLVDYIRVSCAFHFFQTIEYKKINDALLLRATSLTCSVRPTRESRPDRALGGGAPATEGLLRRRQTRTARKIAHTHGEPQRLSFLDCRSGLFLTWLRWGIRLSRRPASRRCRLLAACQGCSCPPSGTVALSFSARAQQAGDDGKRGTGKEVTQMMGKKACRKTWR